MNWDDEYTAEPINISIISNSTISDITNSITTIHDGTTYQLFDITFDIPVDAESGQYRFFVFVDEEDSNDSVAEILLINVE